MVTEQVPYGAKTLATVPPPLVVVPIKVVAAAAGHIRHSKGVAAPVEAWRLSASNFVAGILSVGEEDADLVQIFCRI